MTSFGSEDRLAFCWPGRTIEWTPIGAWYDPKFPYKSARVYVNFVYSSREKLFFCVTEIDSDDLEGWDLKDPASPRIVWSDEDLLEENYYPWLDKEKESSELKDLCRQLRYLVFAEQSNQLFLVTRRHVMEQMPPDGSYVDDGSYPYKTIGFDVHEIDGEGGKLRYMEGGNSLDGMAMFIGINHSFAMSAAEFPELKPNSIYFTDDKELTLPKWIDDAPYGGDDIGIFDYVNETLSPCYYPCDVQSIKRIVPAPIWFTPSPH